MDVRPEGLSKPFKPQQAASRKFPLQFLCNFAYAVLDDETGDLLEYRHLLKHPKYKDVWSQSFGKEIRRLATVTKTIAFFTRQEIPQERRKDITHGRIVCVYHSEKKDPYCTRITMGGNLINYPDDCGTPTANHLTVKLMFNSIISTPGAKFMTIDMKDFYLMTPMDRFEYFRMKLDLFPQDIIDEYGLRNKVNTDGNVSARCDEVCTVSHRQALLPKTSSPNGYTKQATARAKLHPDTGATTGAQSASPSS